MKKFSRITYGVVAVLCLTFLLFQAACTDKALQQLSTASIDVSAGNLALQTTVITAVQNGSLTADQARPVIQISLQVAQAGKQVDAAIRGISTLSATDKTKILAILQPVIAAITSAATQSQLIPNSNVRTEVLAALATVQSALAVARVAVGG